MSWITGARREYDPSLKIEGDAVAQVKITSEPRSFVRGKKKLRDGTEVDDVSTTVTVEYLGGSARSKKAEDVLPAISGKTYTLWLTSTLKGAMLEALGWEQGMDAPVLVDTRWEIARGGAVYGGNIGYTAKLLSDDSPILEVDEDAALMSELKGTIIKIGEIPKKDWISYVKEKGAKDAEALTEKMAEAGYLKADALMVKKP